MLPIARRDDVQVRTLDDETLLYDRKHAKAHALNSISALVWRNCDGNNSPADLVRLVAEYAKIGRAEARSLAELALDQLAQRDLLLDAPAGIDHERKMARRDVLKKLAIAAVAMPIIMSIKAPSAMAQSSAGGCTPLSGGCTPGLTNCCPPGVCQNVGFPPNFTYICN